MLKNPLRAALGVTSKMTTSEVSIFGSGKTFYSADTGWTSKEESAPLLTNAGATYDTSSNKAHAFAFTKPTAFPIHSRGNAKISEIIVPSGSLDETYKRYAEFTISGDFRSRIAAYGSASASYDIDLFLANATTNEEIDRYTIKSKNADFAHFSDVDEVSFEASVSGELEQYNEYRVGVAINTFAANRTVPSAPTPFASGANVSDEPSSFNGYAKWDSIKLEWNGEAEKI